MGAAKNDKFGTTFWNKAKESTTLEGTDIYECLNVERFSTSTSPKEKYEKAGIYHFCKHSKFVPSVF